MCSPCGSPEQATISYGMTRRVFSLLAAAQIRRREKDAVYPIFHGKIRERTNSRLILEVEGGNVMEFRVQKSTRFVAGEKATKPEQFKPGAEVAVEGRHAPDASLDAVSVRMK